MTESKNNNNLGQKGRASFQLFKKGRAGRHRKGAGHRTLQNGLGRTLCAYCGQERYHARVFNSSTNSAVSVVPAVLPVGLHD